MFSNDLNNLISPSLLPGSMRVNSVNFMPMGVFQNMLGTASSMPMNFVQTSFMPMQMFPRLGIQGFSFLNGMPSMMTGLPMSVMTLGQVMQPLSMNNISAMMNNNFPMMQGASQQVLPQLSMLQNNLGGAQTQALLGPQPTNPTGLGSGPTVPGIPQLPQQVIKQEVVPNLPSSADPTQVLDNAAQQGGMQVPGLPANQAPANPTQQNPNPTTGGTTQQPNPTTGGTTQQPNPTAGGNTNTSTPTEEDKAKEELLKKQAEILKKIAGKSGAERFEILDVSDIAKDATSEPKPDGSISLGNLIANITDKDGNISELNFARLTTYLGVEDKVPFAAFKELMEKEKLAPAAAISKILTALGYTDLDGNDKDGALILGKKEFTALNPDLNKIEAKPSTDDTDADAEKTKADLAARFKAADKADNKEGKEDKAIDLAGLIKAADEKGDGLDKAEFEALAKLIGLKSTFEEFKTAKGEGSDEDGVLKLIGDKDANGDKKLDEKEFAALNPPADDTVDDPDDSDEQDAPPLDQRFKSADKLDGKENKSINLAALVKASDKESDGLDEADFTDLAKLLGLKISFADFKKSKGSELSDKDAVIKAVGENDADKDGNLNLVEFGKLNGEAIDPPTDDSTQPTDDGKDKPDDSKDKPDDSTEQNQTNPVNIPVGKPRYFGINPDHRKGVTAEELTSFLSQYADKDSSFSAAGLKNLVEALGWDKARYGRTFVPALLAAKDGMSVEDVVSLMFDKLDGDKKWKHNYGLVRGELGDLVTGKVTYPKKKHTKRVPQGERDDA